MKVRISFDYYPDEPDEADSQGMSEEEFLRLTDAIMELGGENPRIERVPEGR